VIKTDLFLNSTKKVENQKLFEKQEKGIKKLIDLNLERISNGLLFYNMSVDVLMKLSHFIP